MFDICISYAIVHSFRSVEDFSDIDSGSGQHQTSEKDFTKTFSFEGSSWERKSFLDMEFQGKVER